MMFVWLSTIFNFYLNVFLMNTFKQVYSSSLWGAISDQVATLISGLVMNKLGIRISLSAFFITASLGGVLMIAYGLGHMHSWLFPCFIVLQRLGLSGSFNIIYISNAQIFPVLFSATAMGYCNFIGRILAAFAPILA